MSTLLGLILGQAGGLRPINRSAACKATCLSSPASCWRAIATVAQAQPAPHH